MEEDYAISPQAAAMIANSKILAAQLADDGFSAVILLSEAAWWARVGGLEDIANKIEDVLVKIFTSTLDKVKEDMFDGKPDTEGS